MKTEMRLTFFTLFDAFLPLKHRRGVLPDTRPLIWYHVTRNSQ